MQVPQDSAGGGPRMDGSGSTSNNPSFNEVLFGKYKNLKVNGKPIKSRNIRNKINRGELPDLPPSKVDQKPMCLAWYTKAMCNADCPCAADHDVYTNSEISPSMAGVEPTIPTLMRDDGLVGKL